MNNKWLKIGAVVIGIIFLYVIVLIGSNLIRGGNKQPTKRVELEFWNVFDKSDDMKPILADFKDKYGISVNYRSFTNLADYRETLLSELAAGEGPDVLAIHNTWIDKYRKILAPLPAKDLGYKLENVNKTFVDTVARDMIQSGKPKKNRQGKVIGKAPDELIALPMYIDTLALYYNEKIFRDVLNKPYARPELTWEGVRSDAIKLAIRDLGDPSGFRLTGIAAGRADNITRGLEIFYTLFLQYGGGDIVNSSGKVKLGQPGSEALDTFTRFSRDKRYPEYSWSRGLGQDTSEKELGTFVRGKVAMIAGYSYYYDEITGIAHQLQRSGKRTISLENIKISPMPQLQDPTQGNPKVALADYFALGVAKNSKYNHEAWQLILYLTGRQAEEKYFKATGKPSSRRDLLGLQQQDKIRGVFAKQAVYAQSLPIRDDEKYRKAITTAIDSVSDGVVGPKQAVGLLENYLTCLLDRVASSCTFERN